MIVKLNENRVIMLPAKDGEPMLRLIPGINEVPDPQWNIAKKSLEPKLAVKLIEEMGSTTVKGKGQNAPDVSVGKTLKDFNFSEAESIIKQTLDVKLLETWKKSEERQDVRLAILNQIEEMQKREKKGDKKDAE